MDLAKQYHQVEENRLNELELQKGKIQEEIRILQEQKESLADSPNKDNIEAEIETLKTNISQIENQLDNHFIEIDKQESLKQAHQNRIDYLKANPYFYGFCGYVSSSIQETESLNADIRNLNESINRLK